MSFAQASTATTPEHELDQKVRAVRAKADEFARLPAAEKASLLAELMPRLHAVAEDWVNAACRYKGIDPNSPTAAEEWLAGPVITMRDVRLLHRTIDTIAKTGTPPIGAVRTRSDGRVEVEVFPTDAHDKALFAGFSGKCLMQPGLDEKAVRGKQASHYQDLKAGKPQKGSVSLILGAGNVSSIPPTDTIYKMFGEGRACVLKMNPVNEYVGPFLERAFEPLIRRGYFAVTYGAGDVGKFLVEHDAIDDIHITGSDKTHDFIVWGPPGPDRERRKRENDPVLKKSITSELGNVSPVAIVPAAYSDGELEFMARNVASMVQNNGSFNCNAAKILITAKDWPQAGRFRDLLRRSMKTMPVRKAYYPGALDRYTQLLEGRPQVERFGDHKDGTLQWAFVPGLDPANDKETLFFTEPFCGILSEVSLPESQPTQFLAAATRFMNDRLWGTLNAAIFIHPGLEKDAAIAAALDRAVIDLRYGTVAINHWPALGYGFVSPPWGGHPSATLGDIQSGLGWVHNTYLLEGIEKSVVRGSLTVKPTPAWFFDNKTAHQLGKKLVDFEAAPSWWKVPAMAITALRG